MSKLGNLWRRRKGGVLGVAAILCGSITYGGYRITKPSLDIPSALVQRTDFVDYVQVRGQVSARKSVTIAAPYEAGDLQIIKLAKNGAPVKKGDIVVQFDATTIKQNLAQDQSALKSAEAEIKQSQAQARLKEEQDLTDVMKARYDVQSATLDASKQEILSKIDGAEANLKVADAKQKLSDAEVKLKTDEESDAADVESKRQKSEQQAYALRQAERSLAALTLRAPLVQLRVILGIVFGFRMSRLIAWLAGWSTMVTAGSIVLAFFVSISVGMVFGIYPAVRAARLDPVEAIRYE